jgi:hypothetical protein
MMNPNTITFIAFVVTGVIALALLIVAIMRAHQREILIAASALVGTASAAFLTEWLTLWDRYDADAKAAYAMLNNYALHRLKTQYDGAQKYIKYYQDNWTYAKEKFGRVSLQPLVLYDELGRNERVSMFVPQQFIDYLADARADEQDLLEIVTDDDSNPERRLSALMKYKDLVARSWSEICLACKTILPQRDDKKPSSCTIEATT